MASGFIPFSLFVFPFFFFLILVNFLNFRFPFSFWNEKGTNQKGRTTQLSSSSHLFSPLLLEFMEEQLNDEEAGICCKTTILTSMSIGGRINTPFTTPPSTATLKMSNSYGTSCRQRQFAERAWRHSLFPCLFTETRVCHPLTAGGSSC